MKQDNIAQLIEEAVMECAERGSFSQLNFNLSQPFSNTDECETENVLELV